MYLFLPFPYDLRPSSTMFSTFSQDTFVEREISSIETSGFFLMKLRTLSLSLRQFVHIMNGLLSIGSLHNRQFRTNSPISPPPIKVCQKGIIFLFEQLLIYLIINIIIQ